ncbi:MAG: efflux RND transporter permease subunit, partial [Saprospiraceae bacterium]|nr:efflux RND transporter permease subunit [Saprospiraceae bacterium]
MGFNKFFVKNWQFTLVIFIAAMVLGINALLNMPRGEDPPFGAPIFTIIVAYPGTNPKDMEKLVADPIEEELYQLTDIKKINTTIKDGLVVVLIEFNFGVDVEVKNNDVIREINKIRPDLPEGILLFDIKKATSSDVSILQTALISDTASMQSLKALGELLEKNLERIKDVKWSEVQAASERQIKIEIDLEKMAALKLGLNQVLGLIQANNVNVPGGDIDLGNRKYSIKTTSEYRNIEDIKSAIVHVTKDGKIVRLSQVARIFYAEENYTHIARYNGRRAIWVNTAMKDKKNIISTRAQIQTVLDEFEKSLPAGVTMKQAFDQEIGV